MLGPQTTAVVDETEATVAEAVVDTLGNSPYRSASRVFRTSSF
jgi:hypothetical protein